MQGLSGIRIREAGRPRRDNASLSHGVNGGGPNSRGQAVSYRNIIVGRLKKAGKLQKICLCHSTVTRGKPVKSALSTQSAAIFSAIARKVAP